MKKIARRNFFSQIGVAGISAYGLTQGLKSALAETLQSAAESDEIANSPIVISTWNHGLAANQAAYDILTAGGNSLDAVEKGVNVSEDDPDVMSVGYGGRPDREGNVTLDACIMDKNGNAGAVAFLQGYKNAVSIARRVMEKTEHVMLVGKGAEKFAKEQGFKKTNLLTEHAKQQWREWQRGFEIQPPRKIESPRTKPGEKQPHDTIGMIALDRFGGLAGACTTSGLAWKMFGRVGDSPIIGAGMYVDNAVGGAAATGVGEECIKVCGSFLVVETMRKGATPEEACCEAVKRIAKRHNNQADFQVAFVALNKKGEYGYYALTDGFQAAVCYGSENKLMKSSCYLK